MPPSVPRSAALLAALAVLLARDLALAPSDLAAGGGVGLAVYGALALGPPALGRLLAPPSETPPDEPRA